MVIAMPNDGLEEGAAQDRVEFPWQIGVFDSHCHPTDTVSSINRIPHMKTRALTIMATRAQDQALVANFAKQLPFPSDSIQGGGGTRFVVPAFGWHPWFSHQIYDDSPSISGSSKNSPSKESHYQEVLTPLPRDAEFIQSLPDPRPLSALLAETRGHLEHFPLSLVGEIGLDRGFRVPYSIGSHGDVQQDPSLTPGGRQGRPLSPHRVTISHQQKLLVSQLKVAGELQRAASIHGVAAHGALFDALRETWRGFERQTSSMRGKRRQAKVDVEELGKEKESLQGSPLPFPPRLCLHSYSGPPETLKLYLHPSVPVIVYFSFSSVVNFSSSTRKVSDVIRAIPEDRILVESDLHAAGKEMDDLMEDIIRKVCQIRGWSLIDGVRQLASNWTRFVFGDNQC